MGQAKNRGNREQRIAQALGRVVHVRPADFDDPLISALCSDAAPDQTPVQIRSNPFHGAVENDCFLNVQKQIERAGGEQVIGWALWEYPGVFAEAEFHAVWREPATGELIDLNPRPYPWAVISFLPDPSRRYEGQQVDNVRRSLNDDPLVDQYIHQAQQYFRLMNSGELANQHGQVAISAALHREILGVATEIERLRKCIFGH